MSSRPESPLQKLARVLGGVVLTHGRLGHQVLGQILISNLTQAEFAGAVLVSAAGARQRNVFAQAAIGTAAPALAVQALVNKADRRLTRREQGILKREEQLAQRSTEAAKHSPLSEGMRVVQSEELEALRAACDGQTVEIEGLNMVRCELEAQLAELRGRLETASQSALRSEQEASAQRERAETLQRSWDVAMTEIANLMVEKRELTAQSAEPAANPERTGRPKRGRGGNET